MPELDGSTDAEVRAVHADGQAGGRGGADVLCRDEHRGLDANGDAVLGAERDRRPLSSMIVRGLAPQLGPATL